MQPPPWTWSAAVLVCDNYRSLAARVVSWEDVAGVRILGQQQAVLVETRSPDAFYGRLPALSLEDGTALRSSFSRGCWPTSPSWCGS